MNAVVPYVGRLAYAGYKARRAVNWAPYAGVAARAAARVIGRAARGYLRRRARKRGTYNGRINRSSKRKRALFSRTNVGEPVGTTTCKSNKLANSTAIVRQSRTLYTVDLTATAQGSEINQRMRQHVNFRGIKICMEFRNTLPQVLYVNVAIIASKQVQGISGDTLPLNDFFRDNTLARSQAFSNALSGLEFHCLPINSDDYTILKHKRFMLTTASAPGGAWNTQQGTSFFYFEHYVNLKRQVRYLNSEGTTFPTDGNVYLCYWTSLFGEAGGQPPQNAMNVSTRIIQYFREPKN